MEEKVVGKSRIEVVDSLRGFAIMGIMVLHSIEHFNFFNYPELADQPAWLSSLDSFVWDALFFLFGGKGIVFRFEGECPHLEQDLNYCSIGFYSFVLAEVEFR